MKWGTVPLELTGHPCTELQGASWPKELTCVDDGWPGFHIHSTSCLSGLEQPHQGLGCEDTGGFADLERGTLTETRDKSVSQQHCHCKS